MPSFRKDMRALASRALNELKTEVKVHFKDLPPWEDYEPDILERYERKLHEKEGRQRRRAETSDSVGRAHTSDTNTYYRDRRHAKEHQHRQRRHQINEYYNRSSSSKHKVEREHGHGVPRVVQREHHSSPLKVDAEKLSPGEWAAALPAKDLNEQKMMKEEAVPCHEHRDSGRSLSMMTARELSRNERPSTLPPQGSNYPKMTEQVVAPRDEHKNSHRVSGQPIEPRNEKDHPDEFRALIGTPSLSPSSVYSWYSDGEQGTVVADQDRGNQPATQETSLLSGQSPHVHQPISQQEGSIWEDDLDDWKSSEDEEELATNHKRQERSDVQARIEGWRNQVWEGNPEPCSEPSSVSEPRAQSTLERIGNIRLANMSTASVTTRFSEFC